MLHPKAWFTFCCVIAQKKYMNLNHVHRESQRNQRVSWSKQPYRSNKPSSPVQSCYQGHWMQIMYTGFDKEDHKISARLGFTLDLGQDKCIFKLMNQTSWTQGHISAVHKHIWGREWQKQLPLRRDGASAGICMRSNSRPAIRSREVERNQRFTWNSRLSKQSSAR